MQKINLGKSIHLDVLHNLYNFFDTLDTALNEYLRQIEDNFVVLDDDISVDIA